MMSNLGQLGSTVPRKVKWQRHNGRCYLFRDDGGQQIRMILSLSFDWPPELDSRAARQHEEKAMNVIAKAYEEAFP
jgi:hypothetical protein